MPTEATARLAGERPYGTRDDCRGRLVGPRTGGRSGSGRPSRDANGPSRFGRGAARPGRNRSHRAAGTDCPGRRSSGGRWPSGGDASRLRTAAGRRGVVHVQRPRPARLHRGSGRRVAGPAPGRVIRRRFTERGGEGRAPGRGIRLPSGSGGRHRPGRATAGPRARPRLPGSAPPSSASSTPLPRRGPIA